MQAVDAAECEEVNNSNAPTQVQGRGACGDVQPVTVWGKKELCISLVYGGCCLLALSKFLACNGFQSSEFWCASLFDVCYVFFECQTVVVCDFYDFHLVGVRE